MKINDFPILGLIIRTGRVFHLPFGYLDLRVEIFFEKEVDIRIKRR